jgi:hypothetical protein
MSRLIGLVTGQLHKVGLVTTGQASTGGAKRLYRLGESTDNNTMHVRCQRC